MVGWKTFALTKNGSDIMKKIIESDVVELQKRSMLERMKFNKIWIRVVSENPLVDSWTVHPDAVRVLGWDHPGSMLQFTDQVHIAMVKDGAVRDVDYRVEVQE